MLGLVERLDELARVALAVLVVGDGAGERDDPPEALHRLVVHQRLDQDADHVAQPGHLVDPEVAFDAAGANRQHVRQQRGRDLRGGNLGDGLQFVLVVVDAHRGLGLDSLHQVLQDGLVGGVALVQRIDGVGQHVEHHRRGIRGHDASLRSKKYDPNTD